MVLCRFRRKEVPKRLRVSWNREAPYLPEAIRGPGTHSQGLLGKRQIREAFPYLFHEYNRQSRGGGLCKLRKEGLKWF